MTQPAEQHFTYPMFGFWVEIPDSGAHADIYELPAHDAERGLEGRPHEYPRKRITGKRNHPETLLAARVWCVWAREQIKAEKPVDWDGDGETPLVDAVAVDAAEQQEAATAALAAAPLSEQSYAPENGWNALAATSGVQTAIEGSIDQDGKIEVTGISLVSESAQEAPQPVDPPAKPKKPKKPRRQTKA